MRPLGRSSFTTTCSQTIEALVGTDVHLEAGPVLFKLGATLFFVLLNGFFVAAEFALVKVRVSRIRTMAAHGHRQAKTVAHLLNHLDLYLSGCQLGITVASLVLRGTLL